MSMLAGNRGGHRAEINVTPMIYVLLVLIIIFMVITPIKSRGLNTLVPQTAPDVANPPPSRDIVVSVAKDNEIHIKSGTGRVCGAATAAGYALSHGLRRAFFVRGDRGLDYKEVAQVIDMARGADGSRGVDDSGNSGPRPGGPRYGFLARGSRSCGALERRPGGRARVGAQLERLHEEGAAAHHAVSASPGPSDSCAATPSSKCGCTSPGTTPSRCPPCRTRRTAMRCCASASRRACVPS